jgi:hypothetical protein
LFHIQGKAGVRRLFFLLGATMRMLYHMTPARSGKAPHPIRAQKMNARTIAKALALLCIVVSDVWGSGPASCVVQLTREEAIRLLAEGSVRAKNDLPLGSSLDENAVEDAKRGVSAQLRNGWEIRLVDRDDCTVLVSFLRPGRIGSGITVRADAKKRLVDFLQHR